VTRRIVGALLAAVCVAALLIGSTDTEAAGIPRAHIKWTYDTTYVTEPGDPMDGVDCPARSQEVCFRLRPGHSLSTTITIEAEQADVIKPRMVLQTPNGARVMRMSDTVMPPQLTVGGASHVADVVIDVPPGYRNQRAMGRLYIADRGSVLVPPLNIRVEVLHPTPAQLALTPVVVPTNHIKLLNDRFNIREFTVIQGTNLTWTNKDVRQHSVKGTLCDPSVPFDRTQQCPFDQSTIAATCNVPDRTGRIPCIDSGPLDPEANFTLKMVRPSARELLRYFMEDGLGVADNMLGYVTVK
jgi:hypothetical protein